MVAIFLSWSVIELMIKLQNYATVCKKKVSKNYIYSGIKLDRNDITETEGKKQKED